MKNILFKLFAFATLLTMSVSCEKVESDKDPIEYDLYGQFIPIKNQIPAEGIENATYSCLFGIYVAKHGYGEAYTCIDPYVANDEDEITIKEYSDINNMLVKWGNSWFTCEVLPTSNALRQASKMVINFEPNNSGYERKVVVEWQIGMITEKKATFIQPPMEQ